MPVYSVPVTLYMLKVMNQPDNDEDGSGDAGPYQGADRHGYRVVEDRVIHSNLM
jgi:hypothetical protein